MSVTPAKPSRFNWHRFQWKNELHRWVDPILAWRNSATYRAALKSLSDGEYRLPIDVPYISQFATPDLINDYIHHNYDGTQDPAWPSFGAPDPADYAFWSHRVCALACLKMAIDAFQTATPIPTLWQLVQAGLAHHGYVLEDENGVWKDEGWYVAAQIALAADYGLRMTGHSYTSPYGICYHLQQGNLIAATVTPELGERQPFTRRYGGHLVIVFGFRWRSGKPTHFLVHNPSGRYPELRDSAWISSRRFRRAFAYRYSTLEPLSASQS